MVRNKGDKDYTDSEKSMLKSMMKDFEVCKMSDHQMMEVLSRKMGRRIKESFFYRMKKEVNEDNKLTAQDWLDNFVRFGIVDFYKERVEEVLLVQKGLLGLYADESVKKDTVTKHNRVLLAKLAKAISDNSKNLAEIGIGSPIILAKLQSLIPRELMQGDLEHIEKHFDNMDEKQKALWLEKVSESVDDENEKEEIKPDPSKAPTAIPPPIDISMTNKSSKKGSNSEDATAEGDQRIF